MRIRIDVKTKIKESGIYTKEEVLEGQAEGISGDMVEISRAVLAAVGIGGNFITEQVLLSVTPEVDGPITSYNIGILSPHPDDYRREQVLADLRAWAASYFIGGNFNGIVVAQEVDVLLFS